ncbi:uncharacterized protein N7529_007400 [Penicillium soppii]|uniref:uncharacterized protein n=1 Tax=Penicillium soppii TaxID=69789 RepID=UPI002547F0A7|nr:uncharacterized protein N7529_007400 [Penicillium soppii]KAJ5860090.1 hypothetical protein N7529_007400 [Penicillium soppii]
MEIINVDVLVCGGGMSGMACASFAAEAGARTLVIEKQGEIGGSSNYSAGMFWAPQTYEKLRNWVPQGDPILQKAFLDDYLPVVQFMRASGVPIAKRFDGIMTIGIGFPIEISSLHKLHRKRIESSRTSSEILINTSVVKLIQEEAGVAGSPITGAIICKKSPGFPAVYCEIKAKIVVLATGGFQGSPDLVSRYLGQGGNKIFVRSNRGSVGDGLKLALEVGGGTSRGMNSYYGHLLAAPLQSEDVNPRDYLPLAQYPTESKHCLLVNEAGRRFADESMGDEIINQYLARQENRRGFLIFSEKVRLQHCVTALFPNAGDVDRLQKAKEHGCNVGTASTLKGLLDILHEWGVDRVQAGRTIEEYDRVVRLGDRDLACDASIGAGGSVPAPLVENEGPFHAMEVQPSITFTYGGISIDSKGHALTADCARIPGLLVAGVDAGGFSNVGYAGGLALAFVTGLWAAREIALQLGLPQPVLPPANVRDGEDLPIEALL